MLILASSSPRRKEILSNLGYKFQIIPSKFDESYNKTPLIKKKICQNFAFNKALDVAKSHPNDTIIGSDTIVIFRNNIFGKPKDKNDAYYMLSKLSNHKHKVSTAICVIKNNKVYEFVDTAKVYFKKLKNIEINEYIETGEPMDKAGAYGYQGIGNKFIKKIKGDSNTVIGLPANKLNKLLKYLEE